jgi:hypothetical protein
MIDRDNTPRKRVRTRSRKPVECERRERDEKADRRRRNPGDVFAFRSKATRGRRTYLAWSHSRGLCMLGRTRYQDETIVVAGHGGDPSLHASRS